MDNTKPYFAIPNYALDMFKTPQILKKFNNLKNNTITITIIIMKMPPPSAEIKIDYIKGIDILNTILFVPNILNLISTKIFWCRISKPS